MITRSEKIRQALGHCAACRNSVPAPQDIPRLTAPTTAQRMLAIGTPVPRSVLDPRCHYSQNDNRIVRMVFDPLFGLDTRVRFQPRLSRSMRMLDDLSWQVRPNTAIRFHDDVLFQVEDVALTFARASTVLNSLALVASQLRSIAVMRQWTSRPS